MLGFESAHALVQLITGCRGLGALLLAAGPKIEFSLFSPMYGPRFLGSATKLNKALQTNGFKK